MNLHVLISYWDQHVRLRLIGTHHLPPTSNAFIYQSKTSKSEGTFVSQKKERLLKLAMENTTSSVEFLLLQEVQFLEVNDDLLSQWEFVNVLDSEEVPEEEEQEEDDADCDSVPQKKPASWVSSISWSVSPDSDRIEGIRYLLPHTDDPKLKDQPDDADGGNGDRRFDDVEGEIFDRSRSGDGDAGRYGGDDCDYTDDYDGYDLDDELVPWSVNSKFGRQRMRKLGKRAFSKMNNSKRSPHLFVRPGCVRGKHGLGLKHNY